MRGTYLSIALVATALNGITRAGTHANLKIIGVPDDKRAAINDSNGRQLTNQKGRST